MITIKNQYREPFRLTETQLKSRVYSMSKQDVREMFQSKPFSVRYIIRETGCRAIVRFYSSGAMSIGCQRFGRDQVRKLKKWALGGK